jgi:signal transduction histidine kinase
VVAQVLAAANAIAAFSGGEQHFTPEETALAVERLRTTASGRFSPKVLWAASQAFSERIPAVDVDEGLPEAVRQLQGLLGDNDRPAPLWVGIRRIWQQFWGHLGVAPELPVEVQAMARLATYFASSTDIDRTAQITVEAVGQLFGAKVAVAIREKGSTELALNCRAAYGFLNVNPVGSMIYMSTGPLNRSMLDQEPLQVSDVREIPTGLAQEAAVAEGIRSALFMPLVHRGQTLGLLFVGLQRQHWFTPREVGLIHLMAAQAAAAFENAQLIREAEERLEHITELKALTDTILDNLSSRIIVVDPEGRVIMANAAARGRFGSQMPVVIGQRLPEALANAAQVDRALGGEATPEVDWTWENSIFEVQSVPLRDQHGLMAGAICLARDVTEVRSMEQQVRRVEKLAAIGELAAGAAHEIRNPLTSIRGFIQLLQHRASRADGDYFQIILNEIDRIDWIIRDMLLLARPTALTRVPTDLAAVLDELLLLHQSDLQRSNIALVLDYDPAVGLVAVDPKMFRQLMLNLLLNAMQAMPYGGSLHLTVRPEGEGQVAVQVADTGVGISPENLKRLFVPFFTTKEEGTGLGLALCYSIVQAHGGKIDVESQVGHGTTFTITIPVR